MCVFVREREHVSACVRESDRVREVARVRVRAFDRSSCGPHLHVSAMSVCVCVCVCAFAYVYLSVCVCVCPQARTCVCKGIRFASSHLLSCVWVG